MRGLIGDPKRERNSAWRQSAGLMRLSIALECRARRANDDSALPGIRRCSKLVIQWRDPCRLIETRLLNGGRGLGAESLKTVVYQRLREATSELSVHAHSGNAKRLSFQTPSAKV